MAAELDKVTKVGIISCSGEELPEGTLSRQAVRAVLEDLRPHNTVTICLPLFLAGNEGERNFARTHPTITVDGCAKQCAKWATEKLSGPVSSALVVSDLTADLVAGRQYAGGRSTRSLSDRDLAAIQAVAERIAAEVDAALAQSVTATPAPVAPASGDERRVVLIEVKVFGSEPPCVKCKKVEEAAKKAAEDFPGQVTVEKLSSHSPEGLGLGISTTPAVVINGRIVAQGRVPEVQELKSIYTKMLGE